VYDQVRALVRPWPGALTHYRGEELLVWAAKAPLRNDTRRGADPGRILSTGSDGALIATGEGEVTLTEVELVARPGPVPAGTFFQRPGARLGLDIEGRLLRLERRLQDLEREARPSR
jgi:methionyl-tRNA formyltransferase